MKGMTLWLVAFFVALVGTGYAQEIPASDDAAAAADSVEDGIGQDTGVDDDTATEAERELEKDLAQFWGSRREVKVVQRRLYSKDGRFEVVPYAGIIPNDDFIVYYPVGMRAGYHFSEAFAVEASFAQAIESNSGLANFLETEAAVYEAAIREFIEMYYSVDILWAPIYGKISLLGYKLSHFDTFVGLGFGLIHTVYKPEPTAEEKEAKPSGNMVVGFRWFLNDMLNVRTEYRQYFFQKGGGGVSIPVELSLGLGVIF
jgi:outer membrane beta-barrel protein